MFYQKLCETKFVDLFETNNFVSSRFFRISHIIVKKLNFGFSILFFKPLTGTTRNTCLYGVLK